MFRRLTSRISDPDSSARSNTGGEPVAIVDIGSNSIRLVVYSGLERAPAILCNEKVSCGLGLAVAQTGQLAGPGADRALAAFRRFRAIAQERLGARTMIAIATAAVRRARDGNAFIRQARIALGTDIEVISGAREAELAGLGVIAGFGAPDGCVGDLGGGSLELIPVRGDTLGSGISLPVGVLTLAAYANSAEDDGSSRVKRAKIGVKHLFETALPTKPGLDDAEPLDDDEAAGADTAEAGGQRLFDPGMASQLWRPEQTADLRGRTFYAVGGSWRALAKLHMASHGYPLSILHGYRVDAEELRTFLKSIMYCSDLSTLHGIDMLSKSRVETIQYAAVMLNRVIKRLRPSDVVISSHGVREGLAYEALSPRERLRDPLLDACLDMAQRRARSADYAREVADFADSVFAQLPDDPDEPRRSDEARIRRAACYIHDVQWRAHPDMRGLNSAALVENALFVGIVHAERAFIARALYHYHEGLQRQDPVGDRLSTLMGPRLNRDARLLGAVLRAAFAISLGERGALRHVRVVLKANEMQLHLGQRLARLDGERVRRRFAALADELGLGLWVDLDGEAPLDG